MIFPPRNKEIDDIDIQIYGINMQWVVVTKYLGVNIDCNVSRKYQIAYTCTKLSKCVGIVRKVIKITVSSLINSYYSFAYP